MYISLDYIFLKHIPDHSYREHRLDAHRLEQIPPLVSGRQSPIQVENLEIRKVDLEILFSFSVSFSTLDALLHFMITVAGAALGIGYTKGTCCCVVSWSIYESFRLTREEDLEKYKNDKKDDKSTKKPFS